LLAYLHFIAKPEPEAIVFWPFDDCMAAILTKIIG
jgi:hypothetical protein